MDEITKTCLELAERLQSRKSVFVEHRYTGAFCEICRDLHIQKNGGLANAEGRFFFL